MILKKQLIPALAFLFSLIFCGCIIIKSNKNLSDPADFHLYLLVGQSNMSGRGIIDSISRKISPQVFVLDKSGKWVPATDPLHFDKPKVAGVGPGLNFALKMAEKNSKVKIGLIPCAVGGSPISAWEPGAELLGYHPYDDAVVRAKIAMKSGVLKGILLHQGEGDCRPEKSKIYLGKLKSLIERFRNDLDMPNVPFIAGELGQYRENYKLINNVLKDLPRTVPNTSVVTSEGLTHKGDGTHFDTFSARELGKRFAEEMIRLQSQTDNKKYDLYLLVGQSNMAGRGELEAIDQEIHPRVFSLNAKDEWIPAKEPLHYDVARRGTGPGFSFGKTMAEANPKAIIGLIPCAVGATKISYWSPGNERKLFEKTIRKVQIAMKDGNLKGIVWQQGESDSNSIDAPLYKQRLLELIKAFRKELGNEKLPVVIGGLGNFLKSKKYHVVNLALEQVADEIGYAKFSPGSNLGHIGDSLHFNARSQRENGVNMAKAMLKIK